MQEKYVIQHPCDFLLMDVILVVAAVDGIVQLGCEGEVCVVLGCVWGIGPLAALFEMNPFGYEAEHGMEL
jgi:hypothetical protein